MIVKIVTTTRRMKQPSRKYMKVILSQRSILTMILGLLLTNAVMIALHVNVTNITDTTTCSIGCSIQQDHPTIHRRFSRYFYYNTTDVDETYRYIPTKRFVRDMGNAKARRRIETQDEIDLDIVEDEDCILQSEWQRTSFPTCNSVHEFDGTQPWSRMLHHQHHRRRRQKYYRIIGNGFWRDVWLVNYDHDTSNEKGILKTMRYHHSYTPRNFDRMRRDSVTMERLTKSPFIVDLYAFCGTTSLSEFGDGGDIPDALWPTQKTNATAVLSQLDKLRIATQAAIALATVHNIDGEGYPTIAHTDIAPAQFIKVNNTYKLNDFNRARFIAYRHDHQNDTAEMCPYQIGSNPGKNRSPEEYNYEPQTEKVDVYALGNIFYMLLQGDWPFYDVPQEMATELVKNGTRPSVYSDLWFSTDPVDVALKEAMIMCHEQNATERASARTVEQYLINVMRQFDYSQLEAWNLP